MLDRVLKVIDMIVPGDRSDVLVLRNTWKVVFSISRTIVLISFTVEPFYAVAL